jgi:hypothetical protein
MAAHEGVTEFVQHNGAKYDCYQESAAGRTYVDVCGPFHESYEKQEQHEGEVNPDINSEYAPGRYGPASHSVFNLILFWAYAR